MKNITHYKKLLEKELDLVESELKSVGRKNPKTPGDWEATIDDMGTTRADENTTADVIEEYEEHTAILKQLEIRYNEIIKALERIKSGDYGICEIGGEPIKEERLKANPAATTCEEHM